MRSWIVVNSLKDFSPIWFVFFSRDEKCTAKFFSKKKQTKYIRKKMIIIESLITHYDTTQFQMIFNECRLSHCIRYFNDKVPHFIGLESHSLIVSYHLMLYSCTWLFLMHTAFFYVSFGSESFKSMTLPKENAKQQFFCMFFIFKTFLNIWPEWKTKTYTQIIEAYSYFTLQMTYKKKKKQKIGLLKL